MKIGVVSNGNDSFIRPIGIELEILGYEVRYWDGDMDSILGVMKWSDVVWWEWMEGSVYECMRLPKVSRNVVRCHSYEVFNVHELDTSKVDRMVYVNPEIREISPIKCDKDIVIGNMVDLSKRTYREYHHGVKIAYVGYMNHKKNPALLLQALEMLTMFPEYELHWAGVHQDRRVELYWDRLKESMNLGDRVIEYGWVENERIDKWLDDKDYVISSSYLESFCYGIADGMAKGIKPLIHNFVGSGIYPESLKWNSMEDLYNLLEDGEYDSFSYRKFIDDNYSKEVIMPKIIDMLEGVFTS